MQYRTLGKTGMKVSHLSFGASSLGSVFHDINEAEGIRSVHMAIDQGINFIDVSPYYGLTKAEQVLGKALASVPRDNYILATKTGRYGYNETDFDFSENGTIASVDESLQRLGVDYVDLIQCHDIEFGNLDQIVNETLPALRKICEQGKARYIGITGLLLKVFTEVIDRAEVDTMLSYCHCSLNDKSLTELISCFEAKGIGIINASPFSMGLLTNRGSPDWHPADEETRNFCAQAAEFCARQGTDIAKIALQYSLSLTGIQTTLFSTAKEENMARILRWAKEPLDITLLNQILSILKPIANRNWPSGRYENN